MNGLRLPHTRWLALLLFLLALAARFPLGDFWTPDEAKHWSVRVEGFLDGLQRGDFPQTNQSGHPGVTTMWLGTAGLVLQRQLVALGDLPPTDAAFKYIAEENYERAAQAYYATPHTYFMYRLLLRLPVTLVTALGVPLWYLLLRRLLNGRVALLAALLVASDPFLVAHSQVLHLDALLTTFMTLSLLAALVAFRVDAHDSTQPGTIQWGRLVASAVAGGLAFLTKSPSILILPIIGLAALVNVDRAVHLLSLVGLAKEHGGAPRTDWATVRGVVGRHIGALALWGGVALAVWIICWPAAWVDFPSTVQTVVDEVNRNGRMAHSWGNFFLGHPDATPGLIYYTVALVLRLPPWTMLGILAAALVVPRRNHWWSGSLAVSLLMLFALLFFIVMGRAPKKFDRYLLPVFPVVNIVAAIGWLRLADWLWQTVAQRQRWRWLALLPAHLAPVGWVLLTSGLALNLAWYQPYYLGYYNPLVGGGAVAERSIYVGWGEGLDEAGRYIASQRDGCDYAIASWYELVILPYVCSAVMGLPWAIVPGHVNYVVLYQNQLQRRIYPDVIDHVQQQGALVHTVQRHGVNYAYVYQMPYPMEQAVSADFGTLRLAGYTVDTAQVRTSGLLNLTLQWQAQAPIPQDYMLFIHILDAAGKRIGQTDVPPAGPDWPTSQWPAQHYIRWRHAVPVPPDLAPGEYWVALGVYDTQDFARLPLRGPTPPGAPNNGTDALVLPPVPITP